MSNSRRSTSIEVEQEAKLENLGESISDILASFRTMEKEINMGMINLSREVDKLDSSLKNIRQNIKDEVAKQVDEYLAKYLDEFRGFKTRSLIQPQAVYGEIGPGERIRRTKSTVPPPPRYRRTRG